jgi:predicted transcriptional regulator
MVSGINNFSGAQTLRALNAFKTDEITVKRGQLQQEEPKEAIAKQQKTETPLREEISQQRANEIRKYGEIFDMNISNSDINYALTYGRSVIVDYSA